jgi:hypothetical protein
MYVVKYYEEQKNGIFVIKETVKMFATEELANDFGEIVYGDNFAGIKKIKEQENA